MVWLVAHGIPAGGAVALLWVVKLLALGVLLYGALWLALLLLFAVVAAWVARNVDWDDDEEKHSEWRDGYDGYGLYDKSGWRIDMGDPDER